MADPTVARLADLIRQAETAARAKAFEEAAKIVEDALGAMATLQTVTDGLDECAAWGRCMVQAIRARAKEAPRG